MEWADAVESLDGAKERAEMWIRMREAPVNTQAPGRITGYLTEAFVPARLLLCASRGAPALSDKLELEARPSPAPSLGPV